MPVPVTGAGIVRLCPLRETKTKGSSTDSKTGDKAASLAEDDRDDEARAALKDAVAVAMAEGESNAAYKVSYYTRFF